MVQRQRPPRQQPDRQRGSKARERAQRKRRHHRRSLRQVAFERQCEPAGNQMQMSPRYRTETLGRHVERNDRGLAAVLHDGARGGGLLFDRQIERRHALRQVGAEATDVADRERFGGGVHRKIGMIDAVDPARGHDRARPGAVERDRQLGLPPQQRKQRDDEAGAVRGEHGQHELDGVRKLNRDHGIVRQTRFDEVRRERGNRAVGSGEGQSLGRLSRDARLVEGIEQRQRVRLSRHDPAKQDVKRRRCVVLDHGITSVVAPPSATRFPGDSPTRRWPWAVLSDSTVRSIVLAH